MMKMNGSKAERTLAASLHMPAALHDHMHLPGLRILALHATNCESVFTNQAVLLLSCCKYCESHTSPQTPYQSKCMPLLLS